ncbi:hypothetical protein RCO48_11725 [Peribacillus frigoritolerans]|nr:hypothetical protein [Peribacillus frigoritolerans]
MIEPPHPLENYNNAAIVPKSDKTMVMTFHHKIIDVLSKKFLGMITIDIDLGEYAAFAITLSKETHLLFCLLIQKIASCMQMIVP